MPNNLFPYPGNKARHSEWIIQHIPEHHCYVEPFGGAAGVLFNKPKSKVEVYNDLDGDIVHFFEVLRDQGDELQEWLECVPFSRQLHEKWSTEFFNEQHRPEDDIERAGRFFYLRYSQFGAKAYGTSGFSSAKIRNRAGQFLDKVDALDEFALRLRRVVIENLDWEELVEQYDSESTVFYFDPPYEGTEYNYESTFNHRQFYRRICDIEGSCLISHDSVPRWYGEDFQVVSVDSNFAIDCSTNGGRKDATEYLIMNFDADGEPLMSDVGQQGLEAFTDGGESNNSK